MGESEIFEPVKIGTICPSCKSEDVFVIDFLAGCMFPLPDIFAIECKKCGHTGSGYQDSKGWHITWGKSVEALS